MADRCCAGVLPPGGDEEGSGTRSWVPDGPHERGSRSVDEGREGARRRVVCCGGLALVGLVCWVASSPEGQAGVLGLGGGKRVELLGGAAGGFKKWYQEQSADSWFGGGTFEGKDVVGRKREKAKWVTKQDLAMIPKVERRRANHELKARLVQLAMSNIEGKHKEKRMVQELLQKEPTHVEGDMSEAEVSAVLHHLELKFLNHTALGVNLTAVSGTIEEAPEVAARKRKEEAARLAAQQKLDKVLEMANPKLKDEYDDEVQQHREQNEKMDAVAALLKAMTNTSGWTVANISQCGDHCDEVISPTADAQSPQGGALNLTAHDAVEDKEIQELEGGARRRRRRRMVR